MNVHAPQGAPNLPALPLDGPQAEALERALDNIFSNIARDSIARHAIAPMSCECRVQDGALHARMHTPKLATPWPRRAFEPLKSATGSGMGLDQARRSLRDTQGDLQASDEPQGVIFSIVVPLSTPQRQEI